MADAPIAFSPVPGVDVTTLANGLRLLVVPSRVNRHVSIRFVRAAGSRRDPVGKEGLASITATLMRHGAGGLGEAELSEEMDFLAARLSMSAGRDYTELSGDITTLRREHLDRYLDLVADVVRRPAFPEAEVDKVRARRQGYLRQLADDHGSLCGRAFSRTVYAGHPNGRPSSGDRESVEAITRDDVVAHHHQHWRPDGALMALAGDVTLDEAAAMIESRFGDWEPGEPSEIERPAATRRRGLHITLVDRGDPTLTQVHYRIGHPLDLTLKSDDYFPFRLGAQILGGDFTARLNQRLRVKEGLTYGARWSFNLRGDHAGAGSVTTYSPVKDIVRSLEISLAELTRIREETIPASEVLDFQRKIIHAFPFRFETPASTAEQHLWALREDLGSEYLERYQQAVAETTPDQVQQAVRDHIRVTDLDIVLVANADLAPALAELAGGPENVTVRGLDELGL